MNVTHTPTETQLRQKTEELDALSAELTAEGIVHSREGMQVLPDGRVWVATPGGGMYVTSSKKS